MIGSPYVSIAKLSKNPHVSLADMRNVLDAPRIYAAIVESGPDDFGADETADQGHNIIPQVRVRVEHQALLCVCRPWMRDVGLGCSLAVALLALA